MKGEKCGTLDFEGDHYTVLVEWPEPGTTFASDRKGEVIYRDEAAPCLLGVQLPDGFSRTARLSLSGLAVATLGAVPKRDRLLKFYMGALPSLMRVPPLATRSWPGLLGAPETEWFNYCFDETEIDGLRG